MPKLLLKIALPLAVLALGIAGAWAVVDSKPTPGRSRHAAPPPTVVVQKAKLSDVRLVVEAQGVVQPRTETQLAAEVAGKVVFLSPSMAAGGFFEKGEVLIKLDTTDYQVAVVQAKSALAKAELDLTLRTAEAKAAKAEWARLSRGSRQASPLVLKQPHLAEAQAAAAAARAALRQAEVNLARTVIKAPYAGRVRAKHADVGQYVAKGFTLAEIFAVDFAEVRLPLPDDKLAFLDLPIDYRNGHGDHSKPQVTIIARFGGRTFSWQGEVVRTEGELDPKSRMVIAVAQVADPYGRGGQPGRPPLGSGMFVSAEIQGRLARSVVVLPRSVLRSQDQVLVVGKDNRLHFRQVKVLRLERKQVIISSGLADGELVVLTQPEAVVDGMPVRVASDASSEPAASAASAGPGPGSGSPQKAKP